MPTETENKDADFNQEIDALEKAMEADDCDDDEDADDDADDDDGLDV